MFVLHQYLFKSSIANAHPPPPPFPPPSAIKVSFEKWLYRLCTVHACVEEQLKKRTMKMIMYGTFHPQGKHYLQQTKKQERASLVQSLSYNTSNNSSETTLEQFSTSGSPEGQLVDLGVIGGTVPHHLHNHSAVKLS